MRCPEVAGTYQTHFPKPVETSAEPCEGITEGSCERKRAGYVGNPGRGGVGWTT